MAALTFVFALPGMDGGTYPIQFCPAYGLSAWLQMLLFLKFLAGALRWVVLAAWFFGLPFLRAQRAFLAIFRVNPTMFIRIYVL